MGVIPAHDLVKGYRVADVKWALESIRPLDTEARPVVIPRNQMYKSNYMVSLTPTLRVAPCFPDQNDPDNISLGFQHRVACEKMSRANMRVSEWRHFTRVMLKQVLTPVERATTEEEWIASRPYTEKKRKVLVDAWNAVEKNWRNAILKPTVEQTSIFIKAEGYPGFKYPRLISSIDKWLKLVVGCVVHDVEKVVFKLPYFPKYIPYLQRPAAMVKRLKRLKVVVSNDYSSFESLVYGDVQRYVEAEMIKLCYGHIDPDRVKWICDYLLKPHRVVGLRGKARFRGLFRGRASGDMSTSVGNGMINLMVTSFCAYRAGLIPAFSLLDAWIEGDDSIFSLDVDRDDPRLQRFEAELNVMGMRAKVKYSDDLGESGFCSLYFDQSLDLVQDPWTFLLKFPWAIGHSRDTPEQLQSLLKGKALSYLFCGPRSPVVAEVCAYILRTTPGHATLDDFDRYWNEQVFQGIPDPEATVDLSGPTESTRMLVHKLFGMSPELQRIVTQEFIGVLRGSPSPFLDELMRTRFRHASWNYSMHCSRAWVDGGIDCHRHAEV